VASEESAKKLGSARADRAKRRRVNNTTPLPSQTADTEETEVIEGVHPDPPADSTSALQVDTLDQVGTEDPSIVTGESGALLLSNDNTVEDETSEGVQPDPPANPPSRTSVEVQVDQI